MAVIGREIGDHGVSMSGKTDPQIAMEIVERAGVPAGEARSLVPRVLAEMERRLEPESGRIRSEGRVFPGVGELVAGFHHDPRVLQSVLTGNVLANARVKLRAFGLDRFLDLEAGAFGSDHHDRTELIPIALRRIEQRHGWRLEPTQVWVIGDTPRDLACARAGGARCLLVATGRIPIDELSGIGADAVLPDLADVEAVLDLVLDRPVGLGGQ
ncbi:MAG: haloacid dehalogenase-like hydrolase [Actinomycetota bacterium]|nr:haloacid dehalogenase-like hydrolase [Actinomycetota bacterium]